MEEEKKLEQNNIDSKVKEAISNELSAYMNPGNSVNVQTDKQNNLSNEVSSSLKNLGLNKDKIAEVPPKIKPIIRTYKSDAEETIKSGHISSINMAIAESNKMLRKAQEQEGVDPEIKKIKINKMLVITSIVLIFGGALAIGVPYLLVNKTPSTKTTTEEDISKSIITTDLTEKININDLNLNRVNTTLRERVDQSYTKLGQIKNIYLTDGQGDSETIIPSIKFLSLIKAVVPSDIERTLKPQYMFGLHNFGTNQRFLILKTGSFDITYSGMLSWETDLWQDFKEIFALDSGEVEATTTQGFGIEIKKFQDAIFNNKDCRVVKNAAGEIIFLYSIVDKNTVVITTNINTLKELINRINKSTTVIQ
ncbi:MAG: hypothetical protein WC827_02785 [Candidatus Paceibacterota bacterium]|jgi:hypothetical protein